MNRYLFDTNTVGLFINRRRGVEVRVRQARAAGAILGTCIPVLGELFFGVENSATRDVNMQRLLRGLSGLRCWPFDRAAAEEYGRIATELMRKGQMMQQIDIQIAAIARTLGDCTVVTEDSDFTRVSGLAVESWVG